MKLGRLSAYMSMGENILYHEIFLSTKKYIHHSNISCLEHSIHVSFVAFNLANRLPLNLNYESIIKGALLHDFYLYDWHTNNLSRKKKGFQRHGFSHPSISYLNASRYFSISSLEENIIKSHMWPLTFKSYPKNKEAILIMLVDKYCSILETLSKKSRDNLKELVGLVYNEKY